MNLYIELIDESQPPYAIEIEGDEKTVRTEGFRYKNTSYPASAIKRITIKELSRVNNKSE